MPATPPPTSAHPRERAALEGIPHLVAKVCGTWGSPDLDAFLSRLLMDSRDGKRKGLPAEIAEEVLFLARANKSRRALELSWRESVVFAEAYRRIDEADQARLKTDPFDDPGVSHDTIIARPGRGPAATPAAVAPTRGNQAQGLGELLLMVTRSKWAIGAVILVLGVRYVWPYLKPLF